MKSYTATNSSFPAKLLLGTQVVAVSQSRTLLYYMKWFAVETSIDEGNIIWFFYDCL